ncbi:MAG: SMC-Scp complex subunit ScpB [Candidatus Latescibacteria bacterium]|nr:SMC-Scp complex subunit ScpB [Candidatus Latescibacterota bacterium]
MSDTDNDTDDNVVNDANDADDNDGSSRDVAPLKARAIIEALLITASEPVTPGRLTNLLSGYNGRDIREAVDALNAQYEDAGHGILVVEIAGGYQLASRQEYGPWLRKYHKTSNQVRLSQAGLEALAIVAFKQPVTRIEIDSIRGVNSGGVLHTLLEVNMVRIVGRSEGIGKPMLFGTTREFLVHFGLKGLSELPKPKELEELLAEGQHKAEARQLALELNELKKQAGEDGEEDGESATEEADNIAAADGEEDPANIANAEEDDDESNIDDMERNGSS